MLWVVGLRILRVGSLKRQLVASFVCVLALLGVSGCSMDSSEDKGSSMSD